MNTFHQAISTFISSLQSLFHLPSKNGGAIKPSSDSSGIRSEAEYQQLRDQLDGMQKELDVLRQTEASLTESDEKFQVLMEYTQNWDYWIGSQQEFLYVSSSCEQITGYSAGEFMNDPALMLRIIHPDDREKYTNHTQAVNKQHVSCGGLDFRIRNAYGEERWISHVCRPVTKDGTIFRGHCGSNRDITGQKRNELRLRQLSQAVEQSPVSVVITDLDAHIVYVNPRFTELTGYSLGEVLGQNPRFLQADIPVPGSHKAMWANLVAGKDWSGEFHNKKKNGELYWESVSISPVVGPDGKTTHYLAVKEDITQRKKMEKALSESEEWLRSIFENAPIAYLSLNQGSDILFLNPNGCTMLGYELNELVGKKFSEICQPDDRSLLQEKLSEMASHGRMQMELQLLRKNGEFIYIILEGRVQYDINGKFLKTHCILTNVTEKQRLQSRIQRQNEMLSVLNYSTVAFLQYHSIEGLLQSLVDHSSRMLDAPYGEIVTLEEDEIIVRGYTPNQLFLAGDRAGRDQAFLTWQAVDTLEPVVLDDYAAYVNRRPIFNSVVQHAVAEIPIISGDGKNCLGVIGLGRDKANAPFTSDEIEIAKLFAQIAGLAIENAHLQAGLVEQSLRDPLTGMYNRRYLFETLYREFARANRENAPISFIILDIDHFKTINDTYGHGAGDKALIALADHLKNLVRVSDIPCRYGGDEHMIAMYRTSAQSALQRSEELRQAVENMPIFFEDQEFTITISLGIATFPDHGEAIDEIISCADRALYQSKSSGRNRVTLYNQIKV